MDFISGAIVGGLIYDIFKMGVEDYLVCVKIALKDYKLEETEYVLISDDLNKTSEDDMKSKENLEKYFSNKAENTKNIIEKYNQRVNINHSGSGDNIYHSGSGNIIVNKEIKEKKF